MKKKMFKLPAVIAAASVCTLLFAGHAFAGQWHKDGKVWRYTDDNGRGVNSGWVEDNGNWYFMEPDSTGSGAMKTGWLKDNDTWYYLTPTGEQATGWQSIGGAWYYFDPAEGGAMAFNRVIGGYYINASGIWSEDGKGVDISVSKSSNKNSSSSTKSNRTRLRRTSDDDDDEYYYDDDEDYDDEDDERDPDHWGTSYSDDGPGFYMEDLNGTSSGPGIGIKKSSQDYPGAAYKTTENSTVYTTPGQNSYRDIDGGFFDDEEAGGSKEDWLAYSSQLYQSQEKDAGDYSGDYGAKYDYETYTIVDDDGNTRTIINKDRNRE
ncbi:MAG: hypothetical protein IJT43_03350 [Stomatobaculum sp.]|nr:hypothetical protein [Stomatobaculum sp.]